MEKRKAGIPAFRITALWDRPPAGRKELNMASKTTKTEKQETPEAVTDEVKAVADEIDKDELIKKLMAEVAELKNSLMANAAEEEEPEEPEEPEETESLEDEWEQYIDVPVPRHGRGQEKCFYVAVNGRNAQIPADGKIHRIRKPLAINLLDSLEAEARAEQYAEDLPHEAAPASFAEMMGVINDLKQKLRMSGVPV